MQPVRIKEDSWLARIAAWKMGASSVAMTLGHTIHLHRATAAEFTADRSWVLHELKHVEQFRRHGFLPFLFLYLVECLRKGYHNNQYEIEARAEESRSEIFYTISGSHSISPNA